MTERLRFRARREPPQEPQVPSPLAMRLALAYYVERCVEGGTLTNYAEAAKRLGISRTRMSQVMDLMLLNPEQVEIVFAVTAATHELEDDSPT